MIDVNSMLPRETDDADANDNEPCGALDLSSLPSIEDEDSTRRDIAPLLVCQSLLLMFIMFYVHCVI